MNVSLAASAGAASIGALVGILRLATGSKKQGNRRSSRRSPRSTKDSQAEDQEHGANHLGKSTNSDAVQQRAEEWLRQSQAGVERVPGAHPDLGSSTESAHELCGGLNASSEDIPAQLLRLKAKSRLIVLTTGSGRVVRAQPNGSLFAEHIVARGKHYGSPIRGSTDQHPVQQKHLAFLPLESLFHVMPMQGNLIQFRSLGAPEKVLACIMAGSSRDHPLQLRKSSGGLEQQWLLTPNGIVNARWRAMELRLKVVEVKSMAHDDVQKFQAFCQKMATNLSRKVRTTEEQLEQQQEVNQGIQDKLRKQIEKLEANVVDLTQQLAMKSRELMSSQEMVESLKAAQTEGHAKLASDMDQLRRQRDAAFAAQEQGQRDVAALKSELATATAAREDAMQLAKSLQAQQAVWLERDAARDQLLRDAHEVMESALEEKDRHIDALMEKCCKLEIALEAIQGKIMMMFDERRLQPLQKSLRQVDLRQLKNRLEALKGSNPEASLDAGGPGDALPHADQAHLGAPLPHDALLDSTAGALLSAGGAAGGQSSRSHRVKSSKQELRASAGTAQQLGLDGQSLTASVASSASAAGAPGEGTPGCDRWGSNPLSTSGSDGVAGVGEQKGRGRPTSGAAGTSNRSAGSAGAEDVDEVVEDAGVEEGLHNLRGGPGQDPVESVVNQIIRESYEGGLDDLLRGRMMQQRMHNNRRSLHQEFDDTATPSMSASMRASSMLSLLTKLKAHHTTGGAGGLEVTPTSAFPPPKPRYRSNPGGAQAGQAPADSGETTPGMTSLAPSPLQGLAVELNQEVTSGLSRSEAGTAAAAAAGSGPGGSRGASSGAAAGPSSKLPPLDITSAAPSERADSSGCNIGSTLANDGWSNALLSDRTSRRHQEAISMHMPLPSHRGSITSAALASVADGAGAAPAASAAGSAAAQASSHSRVRTSTAGYTGSKGKGLAAVAEDADLGAGEGLDEEEDEGLQLHHVPELHPPPGSMLFKEMHVLRSMSHGKHQTGRTSRHTGGSSDDDDDDDEQQGQQPQQRAAQELTTKGAAAKPKQAADPVSARVTPAAQPISAAVRAPPAPPTPTPGHAAMGVLQEVEAIIRPSPRGDKGLPGSKARTPVVTPSRQRADGAGTSAGGAPPSPGPAPVATGRVAALAAALMAGETTSQASDSTLKIGELSAKASALADSVNQGPVGGDKARDLVNLVADPIRLGIMARQRQQRLTDGKS